MKDAVIIDRAVIRLRLDEYIQDLEFWMSSEITFETSISKCLTACSSTPWKASDNLSISSFETNSTLYLMSSLALL